MDWLLRRLAERLGVEPARGGEAITPRIVPEQPLSQGWTILWVTLCVALVVFLYRREGTNASLPYKMMLAGLRLTLILLALFMLSEAVLSVERMGLPYFVVMVDDSASEQVADQFADPKAKAAASELASIAGKEKADRLAVAQGWLLKDDGKVLRDLQAQHRVRVYAVSSIARPVAEIDKADQVAPALDKIKALEATGAQTRLGAGVRQVLTELRGVPPTAILLLSDGQTTEGEPLAEAARFAGRKGVPLFAIGLGDSEPARDLELSELLVDDVVFVDDLVRFRPKLTSKGFAGEEVTVRLFEKDRSSSDPNARKLLETIRVPAPPDNQPTRVEIPHRPKATGEITYVVEVEGKPRELQAENNKVERTIRVREEKLKVLFVDNEPRYEYRYLKNFLAREKTIDLKVVLLASDPEYSNQDLYAIPTFPASKEDLAAFDVVILGDADPGYLSRSQMGNLVEFVEKGGGVLFIAGDVFNPLSYRGTPLETLLPIELAEARNPTAVGNATTAFRPALTAEGRSSPIFRFGDDEVSSTRIWANLPELFWYIEAPRKKPLALVLAEHPTVAGSDGALPILLYQFVGSGKAMFNAVDDTWRWRLRVGDRYFGRYWLQTIRFLARSKLLGQQQAEVETDRRRYQRNDPVVVRVRFPNPALAPTSREVSVEVDRGSGSVSRRVTLKSSPAAPSLFEGVLPQAVEGEYTIRLLPPPVLTGPLPTTTFRVDPPAGELERVQMNEPELVRATHDSGGSFFTPLDTTGLMAALPRPQRVPLDTDPPIPLWNTWPVLALFLTVLVAEWVLRKRKQMV